MLTVRFYGDLRRRFGGEWTLAARSPREALHALMTQLPGLRGYFRKHATRSFLVRGKDQDYDGHDLHYPLVTGVLKVVPLVQGAGAFGKILAGVVIAAVGVFVPVVGTAMISLGASLALSGIAQLLAPRPKATATPEKADNEPSLAFDGAVNTMGQGGPVPLGYGRLLVGSAIVSVGFSTNNEIVVN
ncbi:tail assembly protein [Paraburkholderia sp. Tr-20389]|uniref:tail assembly protein n=1 Tax=Paraburkholderia sp. Tr-20389 TaxID=2703903 RepID=UPI00197EB332|nr:tail assembly protein [Paraburkholderia sp. Tr-20389]MBN3756075.1 tail assembly protein [Paraburkholderia sp. Tr-20389]